MIMKEEIGFAKECLLLLGLGPLPRQVYPTRRTEGKVEGRRREMRFPS
jgi:hypothetical protein